MELESFYEGTSFPKEKLFIDSDTLQGLLIYIVSRLRSFCQILADINLIEDYIP